MRASVSLPDISRPAKGYDSLVSSALDGNQGKKTRGFDLTSNDFPCLGARILAPSANTGNDAMRARNGGRRLAKRMGKSASVPDLVEPLRPTTPRSIRGSLRLASVLPIALGPAAAKRKRQDALASADALPSPTSAVSSPSRKRVSFSCDLPHVKVSEHVDTRTEESRCKFALERSLNLMGNLYDLRRISANDVEDSGKQPMTLMDATLCELRDTEAMLLEKVTQLQQFHDPINDNGGTRFATAIISQRALAVVKRKAELLHVAEARLAAFEEAHASRESLCEALLEEEQPIPKAFKGFKKAVLSSIHKDGDPADSDKTNFELFLHALGLPAKHRTVVTALNLFTEAVEWWAHRTLQEAQCFASADAIQRLISVIVEMGGDRAHPLLAEVDTILAERLAEKVLKVAETLQARDANTVSMSAVPQPTSAREAADKILQEIREAIAGGAPAKHPAMEKAKNMEVAFRVEEKNRLAEKVFLACQASQEQDAKAATAIAPAIPEVGLASDRADTLEKLILNAVSKDGLPETHPRLKDARGIVKGLRDLDGERKRLAAREKRLAKQAEEGKR